MHVQEMRSPTPGRAPGGLAGAGWWDMAGSLNPRQVADQIVAAHARTSLETTKGGASRASLRCCSMFSGTVLRRKAGPA